MAFRDLTDAEIERLRAYVASGCLIDPTPEHRTSLDDLIKRAIRPHMSSKGSIWAKESLDWQKRNGRKV